MGNSRCLHAFSFAILALVAAAGAAWGQTNVQSGFNRFTVDEAVEIGKQSAVKVEQQLPTNQASKAYLA